MIVRCTGKLLNLLGKKSITLVEAPAPVKSNETVGVGI
jgi:hypothetical protein